MASGKIRRALGAVKDQTSISIAKVGGGTASTSDLDVAIVKATRHDEHPADEKHIREILALTAYSRAYVGACVASLSRRLSKTRSWAVALKALVLVHRLLAEGDASYEEEIFFATRRGTRLLNMSDFRDASGAPSGAAWDFSAFVRTYALYLDERLEYRMQGRRGGRRRRSRGGAMSDRGDDAEAAAPSARSTPVGEMKVELVFKRTQHLQRLLERFLACRPTGAAKNSRIVAVALYHVVKESYALYFDLTEVMNILVDRFMELDVADCLKAFEIFSRLSKQFDDLDLFYRWSKSTGIGRASDFPDVEKITPQKLEMMDELIRGKSALVSGRLERVVPVGEPLVPAEEPTQEEEADSVKALPAPEETPAEDVKQEEAVREEEAAGEVPAKAEEADFLNLRESAATAEEHGDKLALALFDGGEAAVANWEAFAEDAAEWETALVQSASRLSKQKPSLGGGFDHQLLEGLYQQPHPAVSFTGSASSMALPQGQPLLALPAPPAEGGGPTGASGADPFAASLAVAPPSYVQMSEMEKKQQLLVEEQLMWQQYAKDGMQGQVGVARLQPTNPYTAGYSQTR